MFLVALLLAGTARCYRSDPAATIAGLPIVGAIVNPPPTTPAYVDTIGTPAANPLLETDLATWFDPAAEDPYDVARWQQIRAFVAAMGTKDGFAEGCKQAATAAGADRAAKPEIGALGCSDDGTITQLQRFAVQELALEAEVVLWYRGVPGASVGAIESRQAEVRLACSYDVVARQGPSSPFAQACALALGTAYREGDAPATLTALGEAYRLTAGELARLDPTIEQEPGYFEPAAKQ